MNSARTGSTALIALAVAATLGGASPARAVASPVRSAPLAAPSPVRAAVALTAASPARAAAPLTAASPVRAAVPLTASWPLAAQELAAASGPAVAPDTTRTEPMRFPVRRLGGEGIRLDGRLDDAAWSGAEFRSDFMQKGRDRGFDPRVETRVAILYDDDALYVGARMETDRPGGPRERVGRRDEAGNAERLLLSFDTFNDRQNAYTFGVTVGGVRVDYLSARDNEGWIDDSFDPAWDARVTADSTGWSAEMRIPFDQLRFAPGDRHDWGFNVRRWDPATYLNLYWVVVPYYETGWASRFGTLEGLEGIGGATRIEVTPYALARASRLDGTGGGSRFGETTSRYGGDLRAGLGPALTLTATVHPDFGQVEADPARVNLSGFETFFPERRPFFVEGRELFRTRGPNWFYSRRVGSTPALASNADLVEQIESATILGGAKLTGRLPGGLSLGVLGALGDREGVTPSVGAPAGSTEVAPRTLFGVVRAVQELGKGGSTFGLMGTVVERSFAAESPLRASVAGSAFAGGADFLWRLGGGVYEITGFGGGSLVRGTPEAMARVQESTVHLYQRPDADHLDLRTDLDELTGWTAGLAVGKVGGAPWLFDLEVEAAAPGFEIRDAGSQKRSDRIDAGAGLRYAVRDSRGALRNHAIGLALNASWNFGGVRRALAPSAFLSGTWSNVWTTTLEVGTNLPALSDDLTRGGPLMGTLRSTWANANVSSGSGGSLWWGLDVGGFLDEEGGWTGSASASATAQLGSRVGLSTVLGGSLGRGTRQFAGVAEGGAPATYGVRYLFADLDRDELFLQLRSELALATDAMLTLYVEPFVSTGRVGAFGELTEAGSAAVRAYGTDGTSVTRLDDGAWEVTDGDHTFRVENFDYWVRSFRGSAVFRWEWRSGSSLFLIWQKDRWSFADRHGPAGATTLFDALEDPGRDVIAAKITVMLGW